MSNTEVRGIFTSSIKTWLSKKFNIETREYNSFINHLLEGNFKQFEAKLKHYLSLASSYFSTGPKQLEIFYNGFMIGLLSNLSNSYIVESEKESGDGRIDLCIIPKEIAWNQNAIIMEFKIAKSEEALKAAAQKALEQISNKNYESKINSYPNVEKVFKLGIAFYGKNAEIAYE